MKIGFFRNCEVRTFEYQFKINVMKKTTQHINYSEDCELKHIESVVGQKIGEGFTIKNIMPLPFDRYRVNYYAITFETIKPTITIKERLEELRKELRKECISTGELIELQSLAKHIDSGDVELLEAAGVPENKDTHTTDVIFRYWENEVIALFPQNKEYSNGVLSGVLSYMHVGQHSEANYQHIISNSKLATKEQYTDLYNELEGIGYNLNIKKRRS